ncbi:MAG: mannose-1-phosphate guanylyltransferase [Ruminococcus sp.]|nr:mannose-1-phosphate guanylyltransferase [Ruminococcus sp.]
MKITAVIMAGGRGERFWPKSRTNLPKQFLSLTADKETMIQKTVSRLLPMVDLADIFVVTNAQYASLVEEQLPGLPKENIILEPCGRNTAPCISLAAAVIGKKYAGEAMMLVLPSDHLIRYEDMYIDTLRKAVSVAEEGSRLVTIGITPTYPETGYGYIKFERSAGGESGVYQVERFVEKPDLETAKEYLASEKYLWNSGMFVWKTSTILWNLEKYMPQVYAGTRAIAAHFGTEKFDAALSECYAELPSDSIDFGVMEKAQEIYTIPGSFGWDDVGNWLAVERINETNELGNYVEGDVIAIGTERSTICGKNRLIAAVGVEDLIVVDTDDALLICAKSNTQDVKKVIETLKERNRTALL